MSRYPEATILNGLPPFQQPHLCWERKTGNTLASAFKCPCNLGFYHYYECNLLRLCFSSSTIVSRAEGQSSQVHQRLSLQVCPEPYTEYCAQLFLIPCEVITDGNQVLIPQVLITNNMQKMVSPSSVFIYPLQSSDTQKEPEARNPSNAESSYGTILYFCSTESRLSWETLRFLIIPPSLTE